MMRRAAGRAAVALLKGITCLPLPLARAAALPLIPVYMLLRPRTTVRLWKSPPVPAQALAFPFLYYVMRVRLALLSLRHLVNRPDGCTIVVENEDLYHAALRSGKPVVLLGWHQGPVELLHRIPHADPVAASRAKILMTASAFSPALADFMHAGRLVDDKEVVRPGDTQALRRWAREKGILAVMIDQVSGPPQNWLPLGHTDLRAPCPARLLEWIEAHAPEKLLVTVRWEPGNHLRFRYHKVPDGPLAKVPGPFLENEVAFVPAQYNWSYPKITRFPNKTPRD